MQGEPRLSTEHRRSRGDGEVGSKGTQGSRGEFPSLDAMMYPRVGGAFDRPQVQPEAGIIYP